MSKFENFNPLNKIRDSINKKVNESVIPVEDFQSTVGVYGGKIETEQDGKIVWNNQGIVSKIDKFGDAILRTYDEHVVKDLGGLLKRHPKLFFKFLVPGTKRYRGSKEEIFKNIQKLGLEEEYGIHKNGIEIKDKDLYLKGLPLQDIYRADLIANKNLKTFDRFQALKEASRYLKEIHNKYGGIGELVVGDIIFKKYKEGIASEPILNMPDIIFNEEKSISEKEKKATDILDFIISIGAEEFRCSEGNLDNVKKAMKTILDNYDNKEIIALVKSYIKRGRLTLLGDKKSSVVDIPENTFTTKNRSLFTKHNEARVVNDKDLGASLKEIGLEVCSNFLKNK